MKLTRITIPLETVTLTGLAYEPDGSTRGFGVVLAHGFTASKVSLDLLAAYLCQRGYPSLTFDFRGHKLGHSTGPLNHVEEAVDDLLAAVAFAQTRFATERVALVGHSMGALVGFAAAERLPGEQVVGIAAIATGPRPAASFRSPAGAAMLAQRAEYVEGAEPLALLTEMAEPAKAAERLDTIPSLFVAAKSDVLVKAEVMEEMARRAGPQAEFAMVEGGHLEAPDRARGVVAKWLNTLPRNPKPAV